MVSFNTGFNNRCHVPLVRSRCKDCVQRKLALKRIAESTTDRRFRRLAAEYKFSVCERFA